MITHRALYVWRRNFTAYKAYYGSSLLGNIGEPILYLFAMGFGLGGYIKSIEGMPYINYIAPGLIVTSSMYSAVFECTFVSYTRMTVQRTYDSMLATPVSIPDLVGGEILWGATKSLISASVMLLVMTIFGLYTPSLGAVGILLAVLATGVLFASAALCFSAIAPSYEFFNYFFTIGIAPMFFLSGVFFPLDSFPQVVKWFAVILPATHSVVIMRYFFHGSELGAGVLLAAMFILSIGVFLVWLAIRLVRKRIVV